MITIKNTGKLATLSNVDKSFKQPKYTFWAEDGYIHTVDEDTGHYWIKHWSAAEDCLTWVMQVHSPNIQIALQDSTAGTESADIKELFSFQRKLKEVIKLAKEQERKLFQKADDLRKKGSSRIFLP